jgi:hypothetical protein
MTALSTDGVQRVVPDSDHEGMVSSPAGATASIRGILDVVASVRTDQPLPRP